MRETIDMAREAGFDIEQGALLRIYLDHFAELVRTDERAAPVQEVSWGVDWGKAGDKSCAMIIKRLPDGKIEVVAVEYEP